MNKQRLTIWIISGAVVGALLAGLSIFDMLHYEGDWTIPSAFGGNLIFVPNLLLLAVAMAGIAIPGSIPRPVFWVLVGSINACSFALLFFVIGTLIEVILGRTTSAL